MIVAEVANSDRELLSLADILACQLEARSFADESISLHDEHTVFNLLTRAHLDNEDPKARRFYPHANCCSHPHDSCVRDTH